nr:epimerase family protein SDR39U1, chloroplastic [Tanacetum cinerariifolium]
MSSLAMMFEILSSKWGAAGCVVPNDVLVERPDIMFSVCLCARFQKAPKTSHLEVVKRIFGYIKGTTHLELWYPKGTDIETVVYADSNHAEDYVDRKSTSDVPEIYMQGFWATAKLHHNSIHFKIDTRKSVLDLEAFREMLHISPRIPNQPFADLPTEEEILDFLRFLGHSHDIRYLTDVNVNKLYQPWRSFASVINKCLTGKSSGVDSFRLSQAQMLWGFYHMINIDFAYLIWEDFVYQSASISFVSIHVRNPFRVMTRGEHQSKTGPDKIGPNRDRVGPKLRTEDRTKWYGACVFTDKWSLDELAYSVPTDGPYQTNPPNDIVSYIRIDREAKMIPIFMMFAGGPLGSGKQWFSWIHIDDLVNMLYEALLDPSYNLYYSIQWPGVINGTAPNPVRLAEMCEHLGSVLGRPSWLPVPDLALKAVLGEGAVVVLEGQRVVPARAKELGFSY